MIGIMSHKRKISQKLDRVMELKAKAKKGLLPHELELDDEDYAPLGYRKHHLTIDDFDTEQILKERVFIQHKERPIEILKPAWWTPPGKHGVKRLLITARDVLTLEAITSHLYRSYKLYEPILTWTEYILHSFNEADGFCIMQEFEGDGEIREDMRVEKGQVWDKIVEKLAEQAANEKLEIRVKVVKHLDDEKIVEVYSLLN
ncbi:hypothetical protein FGO68_gene12940 [Halteria grandinella]|uniref:Uncharacterized protein n=1 Tax=Halteria grandinella TaxID=5974 RepID=A0A8J8SYE9_HALGN|nr:hypothetical protein FGO68_gene12940 [Halteria grandinella]